MRNAATIFALASAAGKAGVAVVRISGPDAASALRVVLGEQAMPEPRRASLRGIVGSNGEAIDQGLVLWFPGPGSYTGEDLVELHVHGGRAIIADVLERLSGLPGCRSAEAGEFSRRAFENGRLDLTQVEAVADLIDAETTAQRRQAVRQLGGELGRLYERWRAVILTALAHVEASIDFIEEDLPEDLWLPHKKRVAETLAEIRTHLADGRRGERLRSGVSVAIVGPPNAGKSSLMNALARRDVAIVSETAGTTRDVIEVHLDLDGYPAVVADTAGVREAAEAVEQEGVRRALARAEAADLRLIIVDGSDPESVRAGMALSGRDCLLIANKIDLVPEGMELPERWIPVSMQTGSGLRGLLGLLRGEVEARVGGVDGALLTQARHREALERSVAALSEALVDELAIEERAEWLRVAAQGLGRITGRVDVEDLLDVIFADFCIGK